MKKSSFLRLCLCLAVALFELPLMAQGVVVYKKDGTHVKFAYEEIDSIVTYNVGEDVEEDEPVISPTIDSRAVDLGLSVKWASCNVGADSPEEYGHYFAWGETTTKSDYSSSTSITYGLSISGLEYRGIIDADGNLTAKHDAATANWGDNWRMPTLDEMEELINECEWEWTSVNGVNGRLVTGPNGNSIFLPAAGYRYNTSLNNAGSGGYYWSATPRSGSDYADCAYNLDFRSGSYDWFNYDRLNGHTVRPVSE